MVSVIWTASPPQSPRPRLKVWTIQTKNKSKVWISEPRDTYNALHWMWAWANSSRRMKRLKRLIIHNWWFQGPMSSGQLLPCFMIAISSTKSHIVMTLKPKFFRLGDRTGGPGNEPIAKSDESQHFSCFCSRVYLTQGQWRGTMLQWSRQKCEDMELNQVRYGMYNSFLIISKGTEGY